MLDLNNKYNFEEFLLEECKKYIGKTLLYIRINDSKLYNGIYRLKISQKVFDIIGRTGNRFNKCIYSYEFSDKSVYVGLTYNIEVRQKNRDRNENDSVTKYIRETGLQPIRKQLTEYINVDKAVILEGEYVEKYKKDGWNILNQVKTGGIGGIVIKWTKDACEEEGAKYTNSSSFKKESPSAYATAQREGWISGITKNYKYLKIKDGYWMNFDNCLKEALKYDKVSTFWKESSSCATVSNRNGWLDKVTAHMRQTNKEKNGTYSYEYCKELASKCKNKAEFNRLYPSVRRKCDKMDWMKDFFTIPTNEELYTFEYCLTLSKNCDSKSKFHYKYITAYKICIKNNWLNKLYPEVIDNYTKELCIERGKKCKDKKEFEKRFPIEFHKVKIYKWLTLIFPELKGVSYDEMKQIASKYKTRIDFYNDDYINYKKAVKRGIMIDFFPNDPIPKNEIDLKQK